MLEPPPQQLWKHTGSGPCPGTYLHSHPGSLGQSPTLLHSLPSPQLPTEISPQLHEVGLGAPGSVVGVGPPPPPGSQVQLFLAHTKQASGRIEHEACDEASPHANVSPVPVQIISHTSQSPSPGRHGLSAGWHSLLLPSQRYSAVSVVPQFTVPVHVCACTPPPPKSHPQINNNSTNKVLFIHKQRFAGSWLITAQKLVINARRVPLGHNGLVDNRPHQLKVQAL